MVSSAPAPSAGTGGREAATIPYAEADIIGPLDVDDFDAALAAQIERVRTCYQEGLRVQPDLAGIVKLRFVINGAGSVTSATAWESSLDDAGVESCIEHALLGLRFPEPRGGSVVIVRYPFDLRPVW